jgi:hypothetical protein
MLRRIRDGEDDFQGGLLAKDQNGMEWICRASGVSPTCVFTIESQARRANATTLARTDWDNEK